MTLNTKFEGMWKKDADFFQQNNYDENTTIVDWNDDYFINHFREVYPFKRPNRMLILASARIFLNWYVSGINKSLSNAHNTIVVLLSGMTAGVDKNGTDFLFHDYGTTDDVPQIGTAVVKLDGFQYMETSQRNLVDGFQTTSSDGIPIIINADDVKDWYEKLWDSLEEKSAEVKVEATNAINTLGFIALNLMRLIVKDRDSVSSHIITQVPARLNNFWEIAISKIPGPHDLMSKDMSNYFKRFNATTNNVLTFLIENSAFPTKTNLKKTEGVLKAGCMLSLSKVGMGCLHWAQSAARYLKVPLYNLIKYSAYEKFNTTNLALIDLMENHIDPAKNQFTWKWSRLLEDGAFVKLGSSADPEYALMMMGISIDTDHTSELWDLNQFGDKRRHYKTIATSMAKGIITLVRLDQISKPQTEEANRLKILLETIDSETNENEEFDMM